MIVFLNKISNKGDFNMAYLRKNIMAFTLIELLIVVAIIAILAAIAVPNFLEAQVRSKVSRVKSDMRSTSTALEAYFVDNNHYAFGADHDNITQPAPFGTEAFECFLCSRLTTPIAYISTLMPDTFFFKKGSGHGKNTPFHYNERETVNRLGEPEFIIELSQLLFGSPKTSAAYYMFSHGPDGDHDEDLTQSDIELATVLYDPSNGTISNGDIYYFGPGIGFGK